MTTNLPKPTYAVVLADGTTEGGFPNKRKAILRGECSGQAFTVLSPRGFEVHIGKAAEQKPTTLKAADLKVGMTVAGTVKKNPVRTIGRLTVGKKFATAWDAQGGCFLYVDLNAEVRVVD